MTDIDQRDAGRRLQWIIVAWFCTCLAAMMLLWQGLDTESEWSQPLSDVPHVGSPDTDISAETG